MTIKRNIFTIVMLALTLVSTFGAQAQESFPLPTTKHELLRMPLSLAAQHRKTDRNFQKEQISKEQLSDVLWMAYGFNRPKSNKRTVPSARNVQEMDIYVMLEQGVYLYNAEKNMLEMVEGGDHRKEISKQEHFATAPVAIIIVANYDRMKDFDNESRDFYSAVDCGYVSQNIYIACSAMKLGTVACGAIDREALTEILKVKNGKVMLAHPVGMIAQ